jgi:hypothetical protein
MRIHLLQLSRLAVGTPTQIAAARVVLLPLDGRCRVAMGGTGQRVIKWSSASSKSNVEVQSSGCAFDAASIAVA